MVHQVDTGASVLARLVLALVHFVLTVDALIAWDTLPGASEKQDISDRCWNQRAQGRAPAALRAPAPPSSGTLLPHLPVAVLGTAACGCPALPSSSQKNHFKGKAGAGCRGGVSDMTPVQNCGLPVCKFSHL